jgi:hypothetical protein
VSTAAFTGAGGGLPGPIAETFGAFEPRFYGISFLIETPLLFRAWMARSRVFPSFAGPALPVFDDTCLQTALEHEKRHFHDALVSPFANAIFMLRMMAAYNGLKVFNRSLRSGANCLPIPAKAWMAKTPEQRAAWLVEVVGDLPPGLTPPLRPVPLPYLEGADPLANEKPGFLEVKEDDLEAELGTFANAAIRAYMKAEDLMRGPATLLRTDPELRSYPERAKRALEATLTPRNVFETSALAVQLQAAWTNIGEDAANALGKHLLTSELGYAEAFRLIALKSAPSNSPGRLDPTSVSAVAVWCLLGDPSVRDDFDPAVRLSRLFRILDDIGGISRTEPVAELWDDWDARLNLKVGWRKAVEEMRHRTERSVGRYADATKRRDESVAATFTAVLQAYLADQRQATALLLDDPDAYVNTLRYVQATQDGLPVPLLSVELGDDFVAPLEKFPVSEAVRLPRVIDKNGIRGWNRSVIDLHSPPRPTLLDAVLDLELMCKMCDVAFSNETLRPIDSEVCLKSITQATGLVPLFVF